MKIVIIGGVAGGMSAAARARRLDEHAEIVVLERGEHVSFANCGLPYHVGGIIAQRDRLLLHTPASLKATLAIDARVRHEAIRIHRDRKCVAVRDLATGREYEESYDALILSPGAAPLRPPIPGATLPQVMVLRNLADMDSIKARVDGGARRAVIVGAGFIGLELAECLRARGVEVDLVEMLDQVLPPLDREMAFFVAEHLREQGVRLHLSDGVTGIENAPGGGVRVLRKGGDALPADLVILAAGVKPDTGLARDAGLELGDRGGIRVDARMRTNDPCIFAAGDAVEVTDLVTGARTQVPLAGPANRQGRIAAENALGRATAYRGTQGTAIVKVFHMTAGCTGATEKVLVRAGIPFRKAYLHPAGHASYYPGTAPMHSKILFAPADGKLLGAQVVGFDGVDKRVDVLAVALRSGMTVYDLEHLELSYAPPYGSAKDPVNMAGFVAANMLRADVETWYAEDHPAKTADGVIVDVRGPGEYQAWHIPGAINAPLDRLRSSPDLVPANRPLYLYCKVGLRSYLAYRILKQRGHAHVRTLSGGADTFRAMHAVPRTTEQQATGAPRTENRDAAFPAASAGCDCTAMACDPARTRTAAREILVDCAGLQCPGPIARLTEAMRSAAPGDVLSVTASDPGFASDAPAWCKAHGHELLGVTREGSTVRVRIRNTPAATPAPPAGTAMKRSKAALVVFSGDLDRVLAAFVIANGALSMGSEVVMFFTFWGLNALRKGLPQPQGKPPLDWMFGAMMPNGADRLALSKMHMAGMGTAMMKHVMASKNVDSLPALIESARKGGARIVVCTMSMDVMGLKREELLDGVEFGGVASFLGESATANTTLFI